jgi:hypothetical protein
MLPLDLEKPNDRVLAVPLGPTDPMTEAQLCHSGPYKSNDCHWSAPATVEAINYYKPKRNLQARTRTRQALHCFPKNEQNSSLNKIDRLSSTEW